MTTPPCALSADASHDCSTAYSMLDTRSRARLALHAEDRALRFVLRTPDRGAVFAFMKRWSLAGSQWRAVELAHPVVRAALAWEIGFGGEPCAVARWLEAGGPDTQVCRGTRLLWGAELMARFAIWEVLRAGTRTSTVRNIRTHVTRAVEGMEGYLEGDVFCARVIEPGVRILLAANDGSAVIDDDARKVRARLSALGGARWPTTQEIFEAYWHDSVPGHIEHAEAEGENAGA